MCVNATTRPNFEIQTSIAILFQHESNFNNKDDIAQSRLVQRLGFFQWYFSCFKILHSLSEPVQKYEPSVQWIG